MSICWTSVRISWLQSVNNRKLDRFNKSRKLNSINEVNISGLDLKIEIMTQDQIRKTVIDLILLFESLIADEFEEIGYRKTNNMIQYLKSLIALIRKYGGTMDELFNNSEQYSFEFVLGVLSKTMKLLKNNKRSLDIENCYLYIIIFLNFIIQNDENIIDYIFY